MLDTVKDKIKIRRLKRFKICLDRFFMGKLKNACMAILERQNFSARRYFFDFKIFNKSTDPCTTGGAMSVMKKYERL